MSQGYIDSETGAKLYCKSSYNVSKLIPPNPLLRFTWAYFQTSYRVQHIYHVEQLIESTFMCKPCFTFVLRGKEKSAISIIGR